MNRKKTTKCHANGTSEFKFKEIDVIMSQNMFLKQSFTENRNSKEL
jgi:hypothetical protein